MQYHVALKERNASPPRRADTVIRWAATVPAGTVPAAISTSLVAMATSPVDSTESTGMPNASPTSRR